MVLEIQKLFKYFSEMVGLGFAEGVSIKRP